MKYPRTGIKVYVKEKSCPSNYVVLSLCRKLLYYPFHPAFALWIGLTKVANCNNEGCDGGKLLWEDGVTPVTYADMGIDFLQADDG